MMSWPRNIASQAAVGFALVWTITAAAVVGSSVLARDASDVLERTLIVHADDLLHASQAQVAAERIVAVGRGYLMTKEPALLARLKDAEGDLDVPLQALDRENMSRAERGLLVAVQRSAAEYRRLLDDAVESAFPTDDRRDPVDALRERLLPAREELSVALGNLVAHEQDLQVAARQRAAALAARSVRVTIALGALALVLSGLLASLFTTRLTEASRREQASALRATQALAARDDLLGIVAHDLRSPLTAIALRASAIARTGQQEDTTNSAGVIQSICDRMAFLIESLLDAARIEAGRLPVAPKDCRVETVIKSVFETFLPAAIMKSIHLLSDVTPPDLTAWADRERLFQVLSNLIGNALKFTPEQGAISVRARRETGAVRFEVTDTGRGIAHEDLMRVFERYWKADAVSARGAGLGLYIARGIVEAHGGRIWVDSTPGLGSSFRFDLPGFPPKDEGRRALPTGLPAPARRLSLGRDRHPHR